MIEMRIDNAIICKKGLIDIISDGRTSYYVAVEGSEKRCGGQGDILSGIIGTFSLFGRKIGTEEGLKQAVVAACILTRSAARRAYLKKRIGLTAPDIIEEIPGYLAQFYEEDSHKL